jgi:hypothetical protein
MKTFEESVLKFEDHLNHIYWGSENADAYI